MRQGIGCVLREAERDSLAEVRRCLEGWRFVCRTIGESDGVDNAAGEVEIVQLRGDAGSPIGSRSPRLALCRQDDTRALSLAASAGFDDVLTMPLDPVDLVHRLQVLATWAALADERRRRADLFLPYRDQPMPPIAEPRLPQVAVVGVANDQQVRVVAALPPARLTYLGCADQLPGLLRGADVDLVLVTQPMLIGRVLAAVDDLAGEPPVLLAAHAGPPTTLELPPQIDFLPMPAPLALARIRLALALRIAETRRWLRAPPLGGAARLLRDALTGLYNQGAFLDYLGIAADTKVLVGLEPDRLDEINRVAGYAAGNRALAALGHELTRSVRAEDFAAHLGGGRFAVAVQASGREQLERLRCRLEATVAAGAPWRLLTSAEALPARGAPAQRLARLFGDLRRLRPAA